MHISRLSNLAIAILVLIIAAAAPAWCETSSPWIDSWAASPSRSGPMFEARTTIRQVVRTSAGGASIRLRLSNLFGAAPLTVGSLHIARCGGASSIQPGTDHTATFGGNPSVTIAAGGEALSDPVVFTAGALEKLTVSLYLPVRTAASTVHSLGLEAAYISFDGDATAAETMPVGETANSRFFLTDVEVASPDAVLVAFGDSITDGTGSTQGLNARWPDDLAARLNSDPSIAKIAVINAGISGNRILKEGTGPSALTRFDRDALDKPGVRWILLLEGINDIGRAGVPATLEDDISALQVMDGMRQMITRAHVKGIKIWGATLTPFGGHEWPYHTASGEAKRQIINQWIRSSGSFDAVVDFDREIRDPSMPDHLLPAYDSGDHLHLNDSGYKAMADSIDLRIFKK